MISTIILIIFFGCFFIYNTSKKALLQRQSILDNWLQKNKKQTKYLGLTFLLITLICSILIFNLTSGLLFWLFTVSFILSLIIVLYPIIKPKIKHLIILYMISLIIELTLNF